MAGEKRCPQCGAELPAGSLEGLCPKCLMAVGMESGAATVESPLRASGAATSPDSTRFVPPTAASLASHFPQLEILELLGHGGMGAVYKARQKNLDRLVALKIIRPESADTPAFAERFNREARMLARLNHPHIVAIYDFGEVTVSDPGGGSRPPRRLYFFLMEYVDGSSLRQQMRAGDLTPEKALKVVPQICEALQYAHDEGIVHRDIKPENILLDKRGRVKIADFGLAKLAAGSASDYTLTATHHVLGTVRYMAPEQMEGSHAVDHRADIYSLGVVFYEMLTREVPAGHFEPPSKKVQIDVRLDEVVLRALAREPERRYQHASDVKDEVESICKLLPREKTWAQSDEARLKLQSLLAPAVAMLAIGTALTVWLALAIAGRLPSDFEDWWVVGIGGPLLLLGGIAMSGGRSYWLALAASLVCMAIGFATLYFIFFVPFVPLAALLVGGFSLWRLMQPDVQEAFGQRSTSGGAFRRRRLVITLTLVLPMLALVCAVPLFMAQLGETRLKVARRDVASDVGGESVAPPVEDAPKPEMPMPSPPVPEEGPDPPAMIASRGNGAIASQSQEIAGGEAFDISVDAHPGLWSASSDGLVLHPLPNREIAFAFNLINRSKMNKKVAVSFFAPERMPPRHRSVTMPRGPLQRAAAEAILKDFDGKRLMPSDMAELPASGESIRVTFWGGEGPPIANFLLADQAAADKFPGILLRYGLIIAVSDQETGLLTLRHVEISPLRPRNYLEAIAEYDGAAGLRINVSATNHDLVPPEGIKLSAKVEGISPELASRLSATLKAPTYSETLYATIAPNAPDELKATVDVDGYPRAFTFRIRRGSESSSIEPLRDVMDVRIVSPETNKAFKAPTELLPVVLEVDAPDDAFYEGGNASIEVGIDSDRNGDLTNEVEPPLILRSDRQVKVVAKSLSPDGTLTLETTVSDFRLDLRSDHRNLRAWMLVRLFAPPLEVGSEPVEIVLDGAGPEVTIELPGDFIEIGSDVEVVVHTKDLGGVQRIEAILQTIASGNVDNDLHVWQMAQSDDGVGWVVKLKTDNLIPGKHFVLVRATDRVGNVSLVRSDEVQIIAKNPQ